MISLYFHMKRSGPLRDLANECDFCNGEQINFYLQVRVLPPRAASAPPVNADNNKSVNINRVVDNNRAALNAYKTLPAVSLQPVSQQHQQQQQAQIQIQGQQGHIQIQRPPPQIIKQEEPVQISIREHSDSFSGSNTVMVSAVTQNPIMQQRVISKVGCEYTYCYCSESGFKFRIGDLMIDIYY